MANYLMVVSAEMCVLDAGGHGILLWWLAATWEIPLWKVGVRASCEPHRATASICRLYSRCYHQSALREHPTMELSRGVTIGPYRLLEQAGEGGMAEVWCAFDVRLERQVAVKFVAPRFAREPSYLDRFTREARAVSRLDHPNILTVHDFGEYEGWTYMVSPFIGGGTLAARLRRGPWQVAEAIAVLEPLASALDYAHAQGIVHRDVKPQNVLFTEQGRLILGDFGVTRIMEATSALTQTGGIIGTPMYMSPEQAEGQPAGPASDQYSFGIIAYEMLTGRPPFLAETPLALLHAHLRRPLPPPRDLNPTLSEAAQGALFKVLAKSPADRYPSCSAFVAALRAADTPTAPSYLPPWPAGYPAPTPPLPPSYQPQGGPPPPQVSSAAWPAPSAQTPVPQPRPQLTPAPPGQAPYAPASQTPAPHTPGPPGPAAFYAPPMPPSAGPPPTPASPRYLASEAIQPARTFVSRRTALIGVCGALLLAGGGLGGVLLGRMRDDAAGAASGPTTPTARPATIASTAQAAAQVTAPPAAPATPQPPPTPAPQPTLPPLPPPTFSGAPVRTLMGHFGIVMAIGFSPDSQIIASGSHDQTVRLWRTVDGQELRSMQGHNQPIPSIAYAPDGQTVASVSWDRTVRVWRVADGSQLLALTGHTGNLVDVAYSWDSRLLASGGTDSDVRLWRLADGMGLQIINGHMGYVRAVAFAPSNLELASGSEDKTIRLWEVASGKQRRVLENHTSYISKLAYTPNGQLLISVSDDKTIRFWRPSDGSEVRVLEGHTATVRSLTISADGRLLATCSDDKTTLVWSVADGSLLGKVEGHTEAVMDVAFSPDGKLLATSSSDRTIRLWQV